MPLELALLLLLILLNAFVALSEMALVTAREARLKQDAQSGARRAALKLKQQPDRLLSTVQVYITLLTMVTGAVTGESFGASLGDHVATLPLPAALLPYAHEAGFALAFFLVTIVSIVLGELIPKRLALLAPERVATLVAIPMTVLARAAAPLVWLLSFLVGWSLRLLRINTEGSNRVSEEEIRLLLAEGAEQGLIDADERRMVERALRLGDRPVASIMTPRTQIIWLNLDDDLDRNLAVMRESPWSRFPVKRGPGFDVQGVLEAKSLLDYVHEGGDIELFRGLKPATFVPETISATAALAELRESPVSMLFVVDEYGDLQGLVTLTDVMEAVVGAQAQALGAGESEAVVRREDGSWLVDGSLPLDDLKELLGRDQLPYTEEHDFHTLAGLLMTHFGAVPKVGSVWRWEEWRLEVVDLDGARIDKVLIAPACPAPAAAE
ncbi:MAG: hemolysin family protein [Xanthomonadales bacterium]|jgi:putative hemolysin|nr:hemolysin family protein [Xanthomonadales bacterium]